MTDTPTHYSKAQRRLLTAIGGLGVAALAGAAFVLSYDDLRTLAVRGGAVRHRAFLYPEILDGLVVVVILSILAARRTSWWSRAVRWLLLLLLVAGAGTAGVERALNGYRALPHHWVSGGVAAAPWVVLLIAVWLWTAMIKQVLRTRRGRPVPGAGGAPSGAHGEAAGETVPTIMDGDIVPGFSPEEPFPGTRPLPRPGSVRELGPAAYEERRSATEPAVREAPEPGAEPAAHRSLRADADSAAGRGTEANAEPARRGPDADAEPVAHREGADAEPAAHGRPASLRDGAAYEERAAGAAAAALGGAETGAGPEAGAGDGERPEVQPAGGPVRVLPANGPAAEPVPVQPENHRAAGSVPAPRDRPYGDVGASGRDEGTAAGSEGRSHAGGEDAETEGAETEGADRDHAPEGHPQSDPYASGPLAGTDDPPAPHETVPTHGAGRTAPRPLWNDPRRPLLADAPGSPWDAAADPSMVEETAVTAHTDDDPAAVPSQEPAGEDAPSGVRTEDDSAPHAAVPHAAVAEEPAPAETRPAGGGTGGDVSGDAEDDVETTAPRMIARPFLPTDVRLVGPPSPGNDLGDTQPDGIKLPDTDPDGIPVLGVPRPPAARSAGDAAAEDPARPTPARAAEDDDDDWLFEAESDHPDDDLPDAGDEPGAMDAASGPGRAGARVPDDAGRASADPAPAGAPGEPAAPAPGRDVAPPPPSGTFRSSPTPPHRRG